MQSRKLLQVLFVAILCTLVFSLVALAGDREEGKGNPGAKAPHHIIQQGGGPVGHWSPIKKFNHSVPSPFGKALDSCSGSCNCFSCSCYGTYDCCSTGCDICFSIACNAT
jgi:hypothetical protein